MSVKRIRINLATLEYVNRGMARLVMFAAASLALTVGGCNIAHHIRLGADLQAYSDRIDALKRTHAERVAKRGMDGIDEKEMNSIKRHTRFLNGLILRDVFPWVLILSEIENGMSKDIYLEKLSPNEAFSKIEVNGYATSLSEVSNYLKLKETVDLFRKFVILRTDLSEETDSIVERDKLPVRFAIEGDLNPKVLFPESVYGSLAEFALPPEKEGS